MAGIFFTEGMKLHLSEASISIDEEGNFSFGRPTIKTSRDVCLEWARIALFHRIEVMKIQEIRRSTWSNDGSTASERTAILEDEFRSSMQAVVAASTCIDALYDHVARLAPVNKETREAWFKNKTPRYAIVAETLKEALSITDPEFGLLRETLKAIYKLRDQAVHPSSAPRLPCKHPELEDETDWNLATFRGDVADLFVFSALNLIWRVSHATISHSSELTEFMKDFRGRVDALLPDGCQEPEKKSVTFDIP